MRRMFRVLVLAGACLSQSNAASSQPTVNLAGRVFDATTKAGIENLEVKLTPPKGGKLPIRLTSTDRDGRFLFKTLARSRYMVEVSQGVYLLYRTEVDATTTDSIDIPLRRRR